MKHDKQKPPISRQFHADGKRSEGVKNHTVQQTQIFSRYKTRLILGAGTQQLQIKIVRSMSWLRCLNSAIYNFAR